MPISTTERLANGRKGRTMANGMATGPIQTAASWTRAPSRSIARSRSCWVSVLRSLRAVKAARIAMIRAPTTAMTLSAVDGKGRNHAAAATARLTTRTGIACFSRVRISPMRPMKTRATAMKTSVKRVLMVRREPTSTVRRPTSGNVRASATSAVNPASLNMAAKFRPERRVCWDASAVIGSDLLDFRFAEQAGGAEDQNQHQDGEGRHVLVLDRKIGRPEGFDQADQQPTEHGAGQGADAAQ